MTDVIFLLCTERSGSNLISRMFGSHRDLCAPGPAHLLRVFGENAHRYGKSDAGWRDFSSDLQDLFEAKVSKWAIDEDQCGRLSELGKSGNMAQCLIEIYSAEAKKCGKTGLFIKENQLYKFLPFVMGAVDRPRFLYMVRDPRDMALSWLRLQLARGGIVRAARMWARDQAGFLMLRTWLEPTYRTVAISYESLVSKPESTLRYACENLDLTFDEAMIAFHESRGAIENSRGSVAWLDTRKPVIANNTAKFRDALNKDQIAYIEQVCGTLMDVLGYVRETNCSTPFGSHGSFEELERSMIAAEPWDKPGFFDAPEEERAQRKKWATIRDRIVQRPISTVW